MPIIRCAYRLAGGVAVLWATAVGAGSFAFPGQTLTVPDGFEVELVAGPPLVDRPMMAEYDDEGRLYVADSSGSNAKVEKQLEEKPHRIVRLEDTDGDGRFDRSVVFADRLMFPEGVLWFDGAVYTGAPPSIWRLEDTDGDGIADRRAEWFQGKTLTGCANDLHGPYLGLDGWIYWCKGAFARQTHERPGHRTVDDSAAHVFRSRPDGRGFDAVMSGGMDNPVEVAFTPEGEVFFITTFFHHPEAGRRDAIAHCIYGGVYPKPHGVLDGLQRTGDLLPPLVELGPAAACALTYYSAQSLGPEYQGNLFSTLFNLRKVMRHELTADGPTYRSRNSDFLVSDNPDFHPTDVFEDADGSLLVIDTGGWYKICCPTSQLPKPDVLGAIYRIRRKGAAPVADPRGLTLRWNGATPAELATRLGDPRNAVRRRTLAQLAHAGAAAVPALREALAPNHAPAARIQAVWALTRIDGDEARAAVRFALEDRNSSVRRAALHSVGLHRDVAALPRLLALLRATDGAEQRQAAEAIGRVGRAAAVPALLEAAAEAGGIEGSPEATRIREHALIYALIEIADPASTQAGLRAANVHTRRAALMALDQMDGGHLAVDEVAPLLSSADSVLRSTAAWVAEHHPEWGGQLAGFFAGRLRALPEAAADRDQLERQAAVFARHEAVQSIFGGLLLDGSGSTSTRQASLHVLARSGVKVLPNAWLSGLEICLGDADAELQRAAVAAIRALPINRTNGASLVGALVRVASSASRPADLRLEALAAVPGGLSEVDATLFQLLRQGLDPARPPFERAAAATVLARSQLSEAQLLELGDALPNVGPMELSRLLDAFLARPAEAVGLKLVRSLLAAQALSSLRVDQVRPLLAKYPASVQKAGEPLITRLDADLAKQAEHLEALAAELAKEPGEIRRGQALFNGPKMACSVCHAMGYLGGNVGPDLTSIGQIRTERDLLEAIVYPSASIVRSYEPMIVSTSDGEEQSGIIRSENADEIVLVTGVNAQARIPRREVTGIRPGTVSVMPQGLTDQLTRGELSDLLAFLKATRWGAQ